MSDGFQSELRSALDEPTRELRETAEMAKSSFTGVVDTVKTAVNPGAAIQGNRADAVKGHDSTSERRPRPVAATADRATADGRLGDDGPVEPAPRPGDGDPPAAVVATDGEALGTAALPPAVAGARVAPGRVPGARAAPPAPGRRRRRPTRAHEPDDQGTRRRRRRRRPRRRRSPSNEGAEGEPVARRPTTG